MQKIWKIQKTWKFKLDDGWPESVEEQGLLLLVWRHHITKQYIKDVTPCQLRGGAVQPFCSEETACIASSSTKWMRMHDRISLLNVGPWFSWSAKFGYIFQSVLRHQHDSTKHPVPFSRGTHLSTSCGTNITRPKPQSHLVEKYTGSI